MRLSKNTKAAYHRSLFPPFSVSLPSSRLRLSPFIAEWHARKGWEKEDGTEDEEEEDSLIIGRSLDWRGNGGRRGRLWSPPSFSSKAGGDLY